MLPFYWLLSLLLNNCPLAFSASLIIWLLPLHFKPLPFLLLSPSLPRSLGWKEIEEANKKWVLFFSTIFWFLIWFLLWLIHQVKGNTSNFGGLAFDHSKLKKGLIFIGFHFFFVGLGEFHAMFQRVDSTFFFLKITCHIYILGRRSHQYLLQTILLGIKEN